MGRTRFSYAPFRSGTIGPFSAGGEAAAPAWTPLDLGITVLKNWFPMNTISGSNGDPQSALTDASGNGLNSTTTAGAARATLVTGAQNGLNGLRFNSASSQVYILNATLFTGFTSGSMFIVFKVDADPAAAFGSTGWQRAFGHGNAEHVPYTDSTLYTGWGSTARRAVTPIHPLLTSYRIVIITSATDDWSFWMDGVELDHQTTSTVGFGANPALWALGGDIDWGNYMLGHILEWGVTNTKLSTTDRQKVEGYEANKWALTGNLAVDHPYKSTPPTQ